MSLLSSKYNHSALIFIPQQEFGHEPLRNVPEELKKLLIFVLDRNRREEWIEDYSKIIGFFDTVENIGISPADDWSQLNQVAKFLKNLKKIDYNAIPELQGYKTTKSTNKFWEYIKALFDKLPAMLSGRK